MSPATKVSGVIEAVDRGIDAEDLGRHVLRHTPLGQEVRVTQSRKCRRVRVSFLAKTCRRGRSAAFVSAPKAAESRIDGGGCLLMASRRLRPTC